MKIAAGCFGCLFLFCLMAALIGGKLAFEATQWLPAELQTPVRLVLGWLPSIGGSCCCIGGAFVILLWILGLPRGDAEPGEL